MQLASLIVALLAPCYAQAASVFAHFMVGNTAKFNVSDWESNMELAIEAHIDAFALNIAYGWPLNYDALALAFQAAASKNFQLFFSFDYAGNGSWPMGDVQSLISQYGPGSTYFKYQGKPFVSTFEGPANAEDWVTIKANTGCFFIPDWSSLGAGPAMAEANGVADGLFSWAAWPYGNNNMTTYIDASYNLTLTNAGGKPYMMPVSPWFYTNLPGYNKNWAWKGDNLWYDRWQEVWAVQPEFVEIISWNDFGESHYIGPLDDRQYDAFTIGQAPFNYVENMPHDGFRVHLPFMIDTYKNLQPSIEQQSMVMWYRTSPGANCRDGGTTGNTAQQLQIESEPSAIFADKIFIAALLKSPSYLALTDGEHANSPYITDISEWDMVPDGNVGIYTITFDLANMMDTGRSLVRAYLYGQAGTLDYEPGDGFITADSNVTISSTCQDGLANWNAVTAYGYDKGGKSTDKAVLSLSKQGCVKGFGRSQVGNFDELCQFTCKYNYCPIGTCVCTKMGIPVDPPTSGFMPVDGYPANGDDNYAGLCSYACGHGFCPSDACSKTKQPQYIPTNSPFSNPACTAGTNLPDFPQYEGLCSYACNVGFCPMHVCSCTSTGYLNVPPDPSSPPGNSLNADDAGLCDFACSRGYCPSPCYYDLSTTAITWPDDSCTAENKAMIEAELGYAYDMADSAYDDPTYGDFYKRFFSSDLTGDADWVTNLKEKYRRIRDILSASSKIYPLSATCSNSDYCKKNPAWLAHMSDAKKTVNFCPAFWSTAEVRPGASSQFTQTLLDQCGSINLRQVGWSKGFVLVHEATHTSYAMLDEARTVDIAYGLASCTQLPLGTWDRSCAPYSNNGAWAGADGKQGVVPGDQSGNNADSYAFVAAAIYFKKKCGFAIPDPPAASSARKREVLMIGDAVAEQGLQERSHPRDLSVPELGMLERRSTSCPYITDEWVFDGDETRLSMTGLVHFGDSYASGMGTGSTSWDSCRIGSANYGQLLYDFVGDSSVTFQRLSCSGDRTDELMTKIDGWTTMATTNVATLTIGGNDVFFSDIVWNCVITPNMARVPWRSAYRNECLDWEAKAVAHMTDTSDAGLPAKLKNAYLKILQKSGRNDLGLYVAGYPEFFNNATTTCDWSTFHYYYPSYRHWYNWDPRFVFLTQSLRTELNGLVTQLNGVISAAVDAANAAWGGSQVTFVDVAPIFRGDVDGVDHRWCSDNSVYEPDSTRGDTWFFLSAWPDADSSGASISEAAQDAGDLAQLQAAGGVVLPDGSTCDDEGGDPWAWWLCQLAREEVASAGLTSGNGTDINVTLADANGDIAKGDYSATDVSWYLPTRQIKTFHPRTGGMYGYRDAVMQIIASFGQI